MNESTLTAASFSSVALSGIINTRMKDAPKYFNQDTIDLIKSQCFRNDYNSLSYRVTLLKADEQVRSNSRSSSSGSIDLPVSSFIRHIVLTIAITGPTLDQPRTCMSTKSFPYGSTSFYCYPGIVWHWCRKLTCTMVADMPMNRDLTYPFDQIVYLLQW